MAVVLLTDGDERSALAVVRSLGRAGHTVLVAARGSGSLAGASRFASARFTLPDPLSAPDAFVQGAARIVRSHGCDLVLPVTDAATLALLTQPAIIAPARIPMPSLAAFMRISDKAAVAAEAAALGIRIPQQQVAQRAEDLAVFAASPLRPPLVLKPSRSVADAIGARTKHSVAHAMDWPTALAVAAQLPSGAFPLLVQERVIGAGIGVFLLRWNGRTLGAFAHRRLREKPPSGGVSVLCESTSLEPGLLARSESLLSQFDWWGVAMIEYKMDVATSEPVLMEINGRFWGSLQLAIDAGVDFPALLVDAALGRPVKPVTHWREGVRGRWFWGDVDHLAVRLTRSASALNVPPGTPGRLATVADFVGRIVPPWRDQVFRLDDVRPGLREIGERSRGVIHRLRNLFRLA